MKLKSTGTCATNQYIKQINADGSVVCANVPYHWGVTCSVGQYIERITADGAPTCRTITSLINNIDCPANQFLYRHSNGTFSCRAQAGGINASCSKNQALRQITATGEVTCTSGEVSLSINGYTVLSTGVMLQWGRLSGVTLNQAFHKVNFSKSFTPLNVQTTISRTSTISGTVATVVRNLSSTGFEVAGDHDTNTSTGDIFWYAIGY